MRSRGKKKVQFKTSRQESKLNGKNAVELILKTAM